MCSLQEKIEDCVRFLNERGRPTTRGYVNKEIHTISFGEGDFLSDLLNQTHDYPLSELMIGGADPDGFFTFYTRHLMTDQEWFDDMSIELGSGDFQYA